MIDKIVRVGVAIAVAVVIYWGFSFLFSAISFVYSTIALGIIGFLLIVGVCLFILREFGVSI